LSFILNLNSVVPSGTFAKVKIGFSTVLGFPEVHFLISPHSNVNENSAKAFKVVKK